MTFKNFDKVIFGGKEGEVRGVALTAPPKYDVKIGNRLIRNIKQSKLEPAGD